MNYKINWTQNYNTWANYSERMLEIQIEVSEYKEANELINRIKENLK
jgi:hypothetical protein